MALEHSSKRAAEDLLDNSLHSNGQILPTQKRARTETETRLKRTRSTSPDGQSTNNNKKIQHSQLPNQYERPPVIYLNPSQRLDILRRRQRWRQSHLYNLKSAQFNQVKSSKPSNSLILADTSNYTEVSTQTDIIPTLKSKSTLNKDSAKKEAERKLLSGVFSGAIFYDENEVKEANNKDRSPVKFSTTKKTDVSSSSDSLSNLLGNGKKLVQTEAKLPEIKKTEMIPEVLNSKPKEKEDDHKVKMGPSHGFNFLEKETVEPKDTIPAKTFSFGTSTEKKESADEPKKTFSFGSSTSTTNAPSLSQSSSFSIKLPADDKKKEPSTSLFSNTPDSNSKPTFSFGAAPTETSKTNPTPISINFVKDTTEEKPKLNLFSSNSIATSATSSKPFSFGSSTNKEEDKEEPERKRKTAFNFGGSNSTEEKPQEKPAFSFGSSVSGTKPSIGGFSFGSQSTTTDDKPAPKLPSFNFTKPTEEKPSEKSNENPAPVSFSFGSSSTDNKSAAKPLFGASTESKPTPFSFGSFSENKTEPTKAAETNGGLFGKATSSASLFGNSSQQEAPKQSLFGSSSSLDKAADKPSDNKPFTFSTTTSTSAASSSVPTKPSFSFGGSNGSESNKPSFNFGATSKPSMTFGGASSTPTVKPTLFGGNNNNPATNATNGGFTFGSSSTNTNGGETKPSFNFSGSSKPQDPSQIFGSINQNPPQASTPSFNFGSTSTPAQPSVFGQNNNNNNNNGNSAFAFGGNSNSSLPPANSAFGSSNGGFNFGGNTSTPAQSSAFGGQPSTFGAAPSNNGSAFNFGGNSSTADPSKIFGQSNGGSMFGSQLQQTQPQQPSGFGFNQGAQQQGFGGTPMFGGAAAPPTPVGTPIQSRVPGRKIAQIRQRRH